MESKSKMGRPKLLTLKLFVASVGSGENQYVSWALVPNEALKELFSGEEGLTPLLRVAEYGLSKWINVLSRDIKPSLFAAAKLLLVSVSPIQAIIETIFQRSLDIQIFFSNAHIPKLLESGKVAKWAETGFSFRNDGTFNLETREAWIMFWHTMRALEAGVCYNPLDNKEFSAFVAELKNTIKEEKKFLNQNTKLRRKRK